MNDSEQQLSNIIVYDAHGAPHRLASLWAERPVVLALVRHLGCVFSQQQIAELQDRRAEIRAAGAELVLVAPSTPAQVRGFLQKTPVDLPLYADPDKLAFSHLRLRRSVTASMAWRDLRPLRAAWRAGFKMRGVRGDPWQLGGVFVVAPGGMRLFSHRSVTAGDRCVWSDVADALATPKQHAMAS